MTIPAPSTTPASISAIPSLPNVSPAPSEFRNFLQASIAHVEQARAEATTQVNQFLSGESEEIHSAAIASQRAELTTEMFLQVRNKVVQAYQEIMRMQI